jgi:hypothetical protein
LPFVQARLRDLLASVPTGIPGHSIKREYLLRFGVNLQDDLGPDSAMRVSAVLGAMRDVTITTVRTQSVYALGPSAGPGPVPVAPGGEGHVVPPGRPRRDLCEDRLAALFPLRDPTEEDIQAAVMRSVEML